MGLLAMLPTVNLSTRQMIAIGKGVLTYTLAFVLIFPRRFNDTNDYPVVLTSIILVSIAGKPGVSTGACLDNGILGIAGVGVGALGFLILAKLDVLALVKAQSLRYFAFSLLALIMAFSGIYTSILLGGVFSPKYLEAYLEAYCWGFGIVLGVNMLIFPISSEWELRELLVLSLEHISIFAHLIAKTYTLEINDEERAVRDGLNQTIRADLAFLGQKLGETGLEINWTRWSVGDYGTATSKIRTMQQALITSYSSLVALERHDPASLEVIRKEILDDSTARAFSKLRRGTDLAIADIVKEFAVGKLTYHSPAPGSRSWDDFVDQDQSEDDIEAAIGRPRAASAGPSNPLTASRLLAVSARLQKEVEGVGNTPAGSRRGSFSNDDTKEKPASVDGTTAAPSVAGAGTSSAKSAFLDRPGFLRATWKEFETNQNKAVVRLLSQGDGTIADLKLHQPGPSLHELFTATPKWPATFGDDPKARRRANATTKNDEEGATKTAAEDQKASENICKLEGLEQPSSKTDDHAERIPATVMRVFSFLFGMGQMLEELTLLHEFIVPKAGAASRKKTLHVHWFERGPSPSTKKINRPVALAEALAAVRGIDHVVPKVSLGARIVKLEALARSDTSLYAFKTACAVIVFAVFLLAPSLKTFFVTYGLTGGLITIIVAMAPTLGQTFLTFVLQIMGTGFGSIYGMIVLYIFRHVGGFYFNPYGIVVFVAIYSIPLCYIIYNKPMFFAGALLAMNGTGTLIVTEWVYREIPSQIRPGFDNPALRMAKALVAMNLALGIAGIFQIFILRTPARQTLRVKLSELTFQLGSYSTLLAVYGEALCPSVPNDARPPPPPEAITAIRTELITREGQLQLDILALMPLLKFGAAEPAFGTPFQAGTIGRIIRTQQILLDRLREARTALGTEGFSPEIRVNFTDKLAAYRRQSRRYSRALFYLVGSSLSTKSPLPHELPSMSMTARLIQHDAMVLSHSLSLTPEGREIVQSQSFVRFFLVSMGSVSYQLESLEPELRLLFGEVSEDEMLFNIFQK
ncbi:hypothetical protein RQP46_000476 [Phenoliferia psychrophenolica]